MITKFRKIVGSVAVLGFLCFFLAETFAVDESFQKEAAHQTEANDEGFRWRDSLDFNISLNGGAPQQVLPANWRFNRCVNWNAAGAGAFEANNVFANETAQSTAIHQHLSEIAWNARKLLANKMQAREDIYQSKIGNKTINELLTTRLSTTEITDVKQEIERIAMGNISRGNVAIKNEITSYLRKLNKGLKEDKLHLLDTPITNMVQAYNARDERYSCVANAAVTIVVEKEGGRLEAFTEIVRDQNEKVLIAGTSEIRGVGLDGVLQDKFVFAYTGDATAVGKDVERNIGIFESNQKLNDYSCTEGQLISRLFDQNEPILPRIILELLQKAKVTYNDIRLVVLHIHTTWDPCAKCTRLLAGVSRQMNMPIAEQREVRKFLEKQFKIELPFFTKKGSRSAKKAVSGKRSPGWPFREDRKSFLRNLSQGKARFLIEVSSNEHYTMSIGTSGAKCSHAECAGKDTHSSADALININVDGRSFDFTAGRALAIPQGAGAVSGNWTFPASFPPYVVYKRVGVPGVSIHGNGVGVRAPLSGAHSGCPPATPHAHTAETLTDIM